MVIDSWKFFLSKTCCTLSIIQWKHVSCMNSLFYCNINSCVFTLSCSFTVPVEVVAMILNHVDGSRNQVEVTSKIYVILESIQGSSQDSAWFWVTSTRIDSGGTLGSSMQDLSVCRNVLKDYWAYIILCYFYVVIFIEHCFLPFLLNMISRHLTSVKDNSQ